ncbi:beta-carotene 15,15'-monooxygenase [Mucilaginibacter sp. Bleaf8]|uniref:DUF6427 family protein n=1 Tax=Mucilaginibacter sp. Bleaf8 TaxID=2834430 RepID=UPI001BCB38DF|nr:DUF6427 family protein [Mucilaginibacter sp. Bleaf8]MBS7566576.1 beta-carotene 15,15'-monooxygenase [Mucilaginibacter sp. Bleaf8]
MIGIFRNYNPLNIIWLFFLLIIMRVGYLLYSPDLVNLQLAEPFMRAILPVKYANTVPPSISMLLAGIVVLVQSLLINYLVNYHNLLGKPSFLPALMYAVLSGLFTPFLVLSAPLICNFLVIWMLHKLLYLYKAEDAKSTVYDLGMIAALGTLFYLPFVYQFIVVWIALVVLRPFDWRDWAASILGYLTVFFFIAVYYYLHDDLVNFHKIWLPLGAPFKGISAFDRYDYFLLIPVGFIVVLGLFRLQENFFKSFVLVRKAFQLLLFIFLIAGASFYVRPEFGISHFLICTVPISIFFAYYFLYAGKPWFYETLFIFLLIGIIYCQFNTF